MTAALSSMIALGATVAPTHAAAPAPSASVADQAPDFTPSNVPTGAQACNAKPTSNGLGGADVTRSVALRSGPSSACGDVSSRLYVGQRLGGWCRYKNPSSGYWWYYVSKGGEAPYGWIYEGNISGEETIRTACNDY
ncbi:hypothetical protein GT044_13705 [Streptomyces sp. SID335]|uniref:SH3 domain-containing protein n=1 Tax=Streptomyces venezuelae TaxID=54571 RepID=A0A5P2BJT9_STRVZ|nr:hypothetical protein [Streptomyces sp. SID335]MYZ13753.1 hypothetical protein [Streptomyces sp. SID337]NDZ90315.1 hypothetical protein [Streptomyces sp. SID10115]NDZ98373.1 hypothetical protein [Streptomyces sp. SID10116]NEB49023.1 hypothetical protein [Streptomyces sp. SID339]QES30704.1 hypothetical protein DEJ47_33600 [Streptomyces venezuelae]